MPDFFRVRQPVGNETIEGIIDDSKSVNHDKTPIPFDMEWRSVDDSQMIFEFLRDYYVEDPYSIYRLQYSKEFIDFLFEYPKHKKEYSIGLFCEDKIIGYILGREHTAVIQTKEMEILSANFLCLKKEYRRLNHAALLISEITRIANLNGIFQAIYTSERNPQYSFCEANYYHFPLNYEKLIAANIIDKYFYKLEIPEIRPDTRLATDEDLTEIYNIYSRKTCLIYEIFNEDIFKFNFRNRKDIMVTITNGHEFASFFIIDNKCIKNGIVIREAYLYYWHGTNNIIKDAIRMAHSMSVDMFDIINVHYNKELLRGIGVVEGTGCLKYHFFNYHKSKIDSLCLNFILF